MIQLHHHYGCTCSAPSCARARRNQRGFDHFLGFVFGLLFLAGVYAVIKAGLFAWIGN